MYFPNDTKHLVVLEPPPVELEDDYLEPPPSYDSLSGEDDSSVADPDTQFSSTGFDLYRLSSHSACSSQNRSSLETNSPRASLCPSSSNSHYDAGSSTSSHTGHDEGLSGYAPSLTPPSKDAPHPDKVGRIVSGRSPQYLLNPAPPCFSRTPCEAMPYPSFSTINIPSLGKQHLAKGFPAALPDSESKPHPFATHDVTEEDWMHFLADMKRAASLGWSDRLVGNVAPLLVGVPYVPGVAGLQKGKKVAPVMELLHHWNYQYFHPRCLDIQLAQFGNVDHRWGCPERARPVDGDQAGWHLQISHRTASLETYDETYV